MRTPVFHPPTVTTTRLIAIALWLAVVIAGVLGALKLESTLALRPAPNEYNVHAWEVRHFANKWLFLLGQFVHGKPTEEEENASLVLFFETVRRVEELERTVSNAERNAAADPRLAAELEVLLKQRERLGRQAAATIEARITAIVREESLTLGLPIVGGIVWPPVNIEFTTSPRTLAVSPRDRIELVGTTLLREGLTLSEIEAIERQREAEGNLSALAFAISGVGTYPAIVTYTTDYRRAVETAAHEWMHNYLFFKPLGFHYYRSTDLRTMNETVADIVGREVAEAVIGRWPLTGTLSRGMTAPSAPPDVDVNAELRDLRLAVDALLAAAKVAEAEALMEDTRLSLAARGVYFRKLNQAFFAFTNLYAGEAGAPGAVSPIGPMLDELRERMPSLGAFIKLVEGFTSVSDIERALAEVSP